MIARRERIHQCGSSNIDFRSKRDKDSIALFQPWKLKKEYGTMGNSMVNLPTDQYNSLMKSTRSLNTLKEINVERPDPKIYSTAQFYMKNGLNLFNLPKKKNLVETERVAQLDETFLGKDTFTGDSMMIADNAKQRKAKFTSTENNKFTVIKRNRLEREKRELNKGADQETQLVTIKTTNTVENKVNIDKIRDIRMALRRRYASRTNFGKIFKDWDISNNGEISLYDAHKMINSFGIPINYNETRALMSSSSSRSTDSLDMHEFMHMIFSDNQALNLDNFVYVDEKVIKEGEQTDNFKKNLRNDVNQLAKKKDVSFLKEFLRLRIPILAQKFMDYQSSEEASDKVENMCDYDTLHNLIKSFNVPLKYTSKDVMNTIYDEFRTNNNLFNYKHFLDHIVNYKDNNDFFNFKEKFVDGLQKRIDQDRKVLSDLIADNDHLIEAEEKVKKAKADVLKDQIEHREKKETLNVYDTKYLRNSQPNKEFNMQSFSNQEEYKKRIENVKKTFEPNQDLLKELKPKTRFGGNPPHQNTFNNISTPFGCGQYISEKDRFDIRCHTEVDFVEKMRQLKRGISENKIATIRKFDSFVKERNKVQEFFADEKNTYSLLQRTSKLYQYENVLVNDKIRKIKIAILLLNNLIRFIFSLFNLLNYEFIKSL